MKKPVEKKKAPADEEEGQPTTQITSRRKILAGRLKPKELPTEIKFYSFITAEAKAHTGYQRNKS